MTAMYRLIAVDLDDTLLNSHKQLSPATISGLKTAIAAGIKVVPCTGRPLPGVHATLEALGLEVSESSGLSRLFDFCGFGR